MVVLNLLNLYLDWSEANHAKSTHKRVRASIKSFGDSLPPGLRINKLLPFHLTSWLDALSKQPKDDAKAASDNTRHDIASDVLAACNWAAKRIIPGSPLQFYTKLHKTPRVRTCRPSNRTPCSAVSSTSQWTSDGDAPHGLQAKEVRVLEAKYRVLERGRGPHSERVGQRKAEGTAGAGG